MHLQSQPLLSINSLAVEDMTERPINIIPDIAIIPEIKIIDLNL